MKRVAPEPAAPGCSGPRGGGGADGALMVQKGALHARHGLSRAVARRTEFPQNGAGRLKDQTKRELVRRSFKLWTVKTFGRVHPSQARAHARCAVLRKAFAAWREEWWVARREWRLCMRAQCHYRYWLCNQVFSSWQQFVVTQREQKDRLQKTALYAERRFLRLAWGRWLLYVETQRVKRNMQAAAGVQREASVFRWAWGLWIGRRRERARRQAAGEDALRHWARALQGRAWLRWRHAFLQACSLRQGGARATRHHEQQLQRRALLTWAGYLQHRRAKKQRTVAGERAACVSVLRRCWSSWREELVLRRAQRARWEVLSAAAHRAVQLRALRRWKAYTRQCWEKEERNDCAREHYRRHLMRAALRLLALNASQRKRRISGTAALQFYQHTVIGRYWHRWQERCEDVEERNHQQQRETAFLHYSMALQKKALDCWRKCFTELRVRKEMELRADCLYARRVLPQCFSGWREYVGQRKSSWERTAAAEAHLRIWTCTWVFYTWLHRSAEQRDRRLAERMALLHADRSCVLQAFGRWRSRADQERQERQKCSASAQLYQRALLHRTLRVWRDNVALIQSGRDREQQAVSWGRQLCLRKAWTGWREYVQCRTEKKRIGERADHFHHCRLLAHALDGWKEYQRGAEQITLTAERRHKLHQQERLRTLLCTWSENATLLMREKASQATALKRYQQALLSRVLRVWREVTVHAIYTRLQQEEEVKGARAHLQGVRLRQTFQRWGRRAREVRQERLSMERAGKNHQTAVLRKCLSAWVQYSHQQRCSTVMQVQARCFLQYRTCLRCFSFWKRQLQLRKEEAELTDVALWHWSLQLLAKVLEAWRSWTVERRRRRGRLAQSAQVHQDYLLREGVARVLLYTADMHRARSSLALHSQEQSSRRLQGVVRHCAMLWKQQVLGESRPRSVSFCPPAPSATPAGTSATPAGTSATPAGTSATPAGTSQHEPHRSFVLRSRLQPRRPNLLLNSSQQQSAYKRPQMESSLPSAENPLQTKSLAAPAPAQTPWPPPAAAAVPPPGLTSPSTEQEVLLPPSSFTASGVGGGCRGSALKAPAGPRPSHTLLPSEEITVAHASTAAGAACEGCDEVTDQQPLCHAQELRSIQHRMHRFQHQRSQLQVWRRLADVLRSWLQTSATEEEREIQSVQHELEELETRMHGLAAWLEEERPAMRRCAARIHSITSSLLQYQL